jgi:hypothetical protein
VQPSELDRTLIGQRRNLADLIRLQIYGVLWAATGIDQYYPETYDPPQKISPPTRAFTACRAPTLNPDDWPWMCSQAGVQMAVTSGALRQ